jgi:flagella basal body P-ring formation protein FlgA
VLWRGAVVYGGGLRYAVWARVRIVADCTRLLAAENLKPGIPISANQIRAETAKLFPDSDRCMPSLAKVVGLAPSRPVPAGAEIRASLLAPPYDVTRGEDVEVEVSSGGARLALAGKAESNARTGDLVAIRNPSSNRIFRARVNGKAHAIIVAGSPGGY